jgi:hypothetical protein
LSGSQLAELRLGRLQIERVKAFSEPAVDRSEKFARGVALALIAKQPRHAHRRAQFPGLRRLLARNRQRAVEILSCTASSQLLCSVRRIGSFIISSAFSSVADTLCNTLLSAAAIIAMMVSAGAVSKFNIIELITPGEIDHAYEALMDPVVSGP